VSFLPSHRKLAAPGTSPKARGWQYKSLSAVTFEEGVVLKLA
jgi:hypothetical protein